MPPLLQSSQARRPGGKLRQEQVFGPSSKFIAPLSVVSSDSPWRERRMRAALPAKNIKQPFLLIPPHLCEVRNIKEDTTESTLHRTDLYFAEHLIT